MTYPSALLCCLLGLAACGSKTTPAMAPMPAVVDSNAQAKPNTTSSSSTLGNAECEALLEHIFALIYAQSSQELPEAQRPSPQDLEIAKDKLRGELLAECEGASPDAFHYDCTMAAQSREAIEQCLSP